jgi:hypothetical protein
VDSVVAGPTQRFGKLRGTVLVDQELHAGLRSGSSRSSTVSAA